MRKILVILFLLTGSASHAQKAEVFQKNGAAIAGYDVVAFFDEAKPVKGNESYSYQWRDAKWLFSSAKNLEAFRNNPEAFAPQYGGYCAFGMSEGHKAPTEVGTWTLTGNKLYFNYNSKVKELWLKDRDRHIEKADANWPDLKHKE